MQVENDYFKLFVRGEDVVIYPTKAGYPLKQFDTILRTNPRLKITSFPVLNQALKAVDTEHIIGKWRPIVEVTVSKDRLTAEAIVNCRKEEILEQQAEIERAVTDELNDLGIVFGRLSVKGALEVKELVLQVAKGRDAVKGADAVLRYIERPERKPVIREDGSANHYEMNFVYSVREEAWLGEKIPAESGVEGMDIFGELIPAQSGKDDQLKFDPKSVLMIEEDGRDVLRAKHGGTVEFIRGIVHVGNLLVIEEDVGPKTGDIQFNGSVTIKGTVQPGYSVKATGDVSIEFAEGITNAHLIQSTEGDIYIKGGVFGGDETTIEAVGQIFLKHANNCKIYGRSIHVGTYLFGTEVIANEVYVDGEHGKIIGGNIEALFTVKAATIGNLHERETIIRVTGINQAEHRKNAQTLVVKLKEQQAILAKVTQYIEATNKIDTTLTFQQQQAQKQAVTSRNSLVTEIERNETELAKILNLLKVTEKPEVHIAKNVYPGTKIEVGKRTFSIKHETHGIFGSELEVDKDEPKSI